MKLRIVLLGIVLSVVMHAGSVRAQQLQGPLLPKSPTSADNVKLSIQDQTCGGGLPYKGNPYRVSMALNNITVNLGEHVVNVFPLCPAAPREEIDLGRLPAGSYTLTVIALPGITSGGTLINNYPFVVTDARASKAAPYVRLDYSGTWWDANDPGWGLFIWQDANKPADTIFAAWFTFTPDGKSAWYTFQPAWATTSTTAEAPLVQAARLPGASNPPAGANINTQVGTASLDFTTLGGGDEGKLTYTLGTGAKQVRTIKRFKP